MTYEPYRKGKFGRRYEQREDIGKESHLQVRRDLRVNYPAYNLTLKILEPRTVRQHISVV